MPRSGYLCIYCYWRKSWLVLDTFLQSGDNDSPDAWTNLARPPFKDHFVILWLEVYLEETVDWGWLKVKLYQINSYFWLEFWLVRRSWWLLLWLWATTEITFLSLILAGVQSSHHTGWHSVSSPVSTTSRCGEERRVKWIISTCQGKLFSKIFRHFLCWENLLFIRRVEGELVHVSCLHIINRARPRPTLDTEI